MIDRYDRSMLIVNDDVDADDIGRYIEMSRIADVDADDRDIDADGAPKMKKASMGR
jgi:hypothetical protein